MQSCRNKSSVIAGIMPVITLKGMARMATWLRCAFPARLLNRYAAEDDARVEKVGVHWATEQVSDLIIRCARHPFYTLNQSKAIFRYTIPWRNQLGTIRQLTQSTLTGAFLHVELLLIILFIIINGIFALAEIVIVSSRKAPAATCKRRQTGRTHGTSLAQKPTMLLSTTQAVLPLSNNDRRNR